MNAPDVQAIANRTKLPVLLVKTALKQWDHFMEYSDRRTQGTLKWNDHERMTFIAGWAAGYLLASKCKEGHKHN